MNQNKILMSAAALCITLAMPAQAEVPFPTIEVAFQAAPRERIWDGRIEAVNQTTVSAQTSGRIAELPFDVNEFVESGSVIVRLTDTEQRASLEHAQATLQEGQARYAQADKEYTRVSSMHKNKTVSQARYDQANADRAAASARLSAARSSVATATEQLEYTLVRAPYAGIVAKRHVELGELVTPGQALITGLSLQSLRVNVDVPQSMFHSVHTIGKAFVYDDGKRIAAESLTFFPVADVAANTFQVRVNLPDGSATLYPGMFVKVGFVVGESHRLLIPADAVVRRSELSAVYVVNGDLVTLRQVRLGRRYGDSIEALAGLTEGEMVAGDPVSAGIYLKEQSGAK